MSLTTLQIAALPVDPNPRIIINSDLNDRPFFIEADKTGADATTGDAVFTDEEQTLENKTLVAPIINIGSDAEGDL